MEERADALVDKNALKSLFKFAVQTCSRQFQRAKTALSAPPWGSRFGIDLVCVCSMLLPRCLA